MQGRCYTIQYDQKLQIEMEKDSLIIDLNKELSLSVFLHQPGFFLLTYNSLTMPTLDLVLDHTEVGDSYLTLMLEVVQHQRLSREHIQKERKSQGLDVTDRINLTISSEDEFVHETITNFSKYITNETLTLDLITKKESSENKVYDRFLDVFIERSTNNS